MASDLCGLWRMRSLGRHRVSWQAADVPGVLWAEAGMFLQSRSKIVKYTVIVSCGCPRVGPSMDIQHVEACHACPCLGVGMCGTGGRELECVLSVKRADFRLVHYLVSMTDPQQQGC